jgi:hypothetical protein
MSTKENPKYCDSKEKMRGRQQKKQKNNGQEENISTLDLFYKLKHKTP